MRDQTAALHFTGNETLVDTLEGVTRNIATGYTLGSGAKAKRSFAKAIEGLQHYIAQVQERLAAGHLVTETSTLLINQTNTLIKELEAL